MIRLVLLRTHTAHLPIFFSILYHFISSLSLCLQYIYRLSHIFFIGLDCSYAAEYFELVFVLYIYFSDFLRFSLIFPCLSYGLTHATFDLVLSRMCFGHYFCLSPCVLLISLSVR